MVFWLFQCLEHLRLHEAWEGLLGYFLWMLMNNGEVLSFSCGFLILLSNISNMSALKGTGPRLPRFLIILVGLEG